MIRCCAAAVKRFSGIRRSASFLSSVEPLPESSLPVLPPSIPDATQHVAVDLVTFAVRRWRT